MNELDKLVKEIIGTVEKNGPDKIWTTHSQMQLLLLQGETEIVFQNGGGKYFVVKYKNITFVHQCGENKKDTCPKI